MKIRLFATLSSTIDVTVTNVSFNWTSESAPLLVLSPNDTQELFNALWRKGMRAVDRKPKITFTNLK